MTNRQNCPAALTWQSWFIASFLATLPIVLAIVTMMIVERADFPSASFFAYAIDSLGLILYHVGGVLLFWLSILYFFRCRELRRGAAILIGILVEVIVRSGFVFKDAGEPSTWNPAEITFYIVMTQFFLLPGGVIGGLLAWFYVRRIRRNHSALTD